MMEFYTETQKLKKRNIKKQRNEIEKAQNNCLTHENIQPKLNKKSDKKNL